ncbi:putative lipoprotein, partial [Chlamydia psittaci 02DC14]
MFKKLKVNLK